MTINDEILRGRMPRLGTISGGYTNDRGYPAKHRKFVFHTNDQLTAEALRQQYGGDLQESHGEQWTYDVLSDSDEAEVFVIPAAFRQDLEQWRTAQCLRRCDGVTMSVRDGQRTNEPCLCKIERERGGDKWTCSPTTVLAVMLDLDSTSLGMWEIRSGSWATAGNLKGAMQTVAMLGLTNRPLVPGVLRLVINNVRNPEDGKVQWVPDFDLQPTAPREVLRQLVVGGAALEQGDAPALGSGTPTAGRPAELPTGDDAPDPMRAEPVRVQLMREWQEIGERIEVLDDGVPEEHTVAVQLRADFAKWFGEGKGTRDITDDEFAEWLNFARGVVADAEDDAVTTAKETAEPPVQEAPEAPDLPPPPDDDVPF